MTRSPLPRNNARFPFGKRPPIAFVAFLTLVVSCAASRPALAKDENGKPGQRLEEVEETLKEERAKQRRLDEKAKELNSELERLRRETVEAARVIQSYEAEATKLEERLRELRQREKGSRTRFRETRKQTSRVLMALARMARNPPEALIVQPKSPSQTVRSAILLRAAVPEIESRAARLRERLSDVAAAQEAVAQRRRRLQDVMATLQREQELIEKMMARKAALKSEALKDSAKLEKHVAALAKEAKNLRELVDTLRREARERDKRRRAHEILKKAPPKPSKASKLANRPFTKSRGSLLRPAVGPVVERYGGKGGAGMKRKGIMIETRAGARIIAPFRGEVVFADRFRGYGRLLIIDHGEGYHTLLAGLSRIDVKVGQPVVAGEPVGVMERSRDKTPNLYVELRRKGQPINPLPWLTTQKAKVNK